MSATNPTLTCPRCQRQDQTFATRLGPRRFLCCGRCFITQPQDIETAPPQSIEQITGVEELLLRFALVQPADAIGPFAWLPDDIAALAAHCRRQAAHTPALVA